MMDPITADLMRHSLRTDSISPALLRSRKILCTIFMHILQAEIITTCLLFLTFTVSLILFDDIIGELPLLPLHIFIFWHSHTHPLGVCGLNNPNSAALSNTFNVSEREGT